MPPSPLSSDAPPGSIPIARQRSMQRCRARGSHCLRCPVSILVDRRRSMQSWDQSARWSRLAPQVSIPIARQRSMQRRVLSSPHAGSAVLIPIARQRSMQPARSMATACDSPQFQSPSTAGGRCERWRQHPNPSATAPLLVYRSISPWARPFDAALAHYAGSAWSQMCSTRGGLKPSCSSCLMVPSHAGCRKALSAVAAPVWSPAARASWTCSQRCRSRLMAATESACAASIAS